MTRVKGREAARARAIRRLRTCTMAVDSLVSCAWLKEQLETGGQDIRVLDGMLPMRMHRTVAGWSVIVSGLG